jgi:Cof subfamily protein (haloacid dehalogenase superfamily)
MDAMDDLPDIRLVAIDLDGTLLDSRKRVSDRTVQALGCLRPGVRVVIASARPPRSVRHIYQSLALDTWQINYNGALVWDEPGNRVVKHTPMEGALVRRIINEARGHFPNVLVSCEILDRWHTDRFDPSYTTETGKLFAPDVVAPVEEFCDRPITKLMLLGDVPMISRLQSLLSQYSEISVIRSDPDLLQIMHPTASKAVALRFVAAHHGVPMQNVMAIGDAANDIPMLEAAGVAIAMDNADARVKAVAHWVAPSNDDHGVHATLEKYGLCRS